MRDKKSNIFEKIQQISDYYGFKSLNDFAINGLNYKASQKLNRLKDINKKPSIDIIFDISNKFENINLNWLFTGQGEMLKEPQKNTGESSPLPCSELAIKLKEKEQQILRLEAHIKDLSSTVADLRADKNNLYSELKESQKRERALHSEISSLKNIPKLTE